MPAAVDLPSKVHTCPEDSGQTESLHTSAKARGRGPRSELPQGVWPTNTEGSASRAPRREPDPCTVIKRASQNDV